MEFLIFWILFAVVAMIVGAKKDRAGLGFILGFLFGPFGILAIFLMQGNRRECPGCKEPIHPEATICPHCLSPTAFRANGELTEKEKQRAIW